MLIIYFESGNIFWNCTLFFQSPQLGSAYTTVQGTDELLELPVHHEMVYNDVSSYHSHMDDYRLSPYQQVKLKQNV